MPVRFIGNYSSGKMGFAIALEAANRGAEVTLVAGHTHLTIQHPLVKRINVKSGAEMFEAAKSYYADTDVNIFSAAVADYAPTITADKKIKKSDGNPMQIDLAETTDIAKTLGVKKEDHQLNVGFALETHDGQDNAQRKSNQKTSI